MSLRLVGVSVVDGANAIAEMFSPFSSSASASMKSARFIGRSIRAPNRYLKQALIWANATSFGPHWATID
jgi:hypothetical protein